MGLIGPNVRLITHCYVVTRLKMGVDVIVLTLCAFLACARTTSPSFPCSLFKNDVSGY